MPPRVLSKRELPLRAESDVADARQLVRELASQRRFDAFAVAALVTATSELARNTWHHGKGGKVTIEELTDERNRFGFRLSFVDEGPGIVELQRALAGGYSTGRSLGLGLSGSRRLVDEFHIDTKVGAGTTVIVTKWSR